MKINNTKRKCTRWNLWWRCAIIWASLLLLIMLPSAEGRVTDQNRPYTEISEICATHLILPLRFPLGSTVRSVYISDTVPGQYRVQVKYVLASPLSYEATYAWYRRQYSKEGLSWLGEHSAKTLSTRYVFVLNKDLPLGMSARPHGGVEFEVIKSPSSSDLEAFSLQRWQQSAPMITVFVMLPTWSTQAFLRDDNMVAVPMPE